MKLKNIRLICVFILGTIIGAVIVFAIGIIIARLSYTTELTTLHKTFGDIEIWAQKPIISNDEKVPIDFGQEADRILWMTKDGAPFLMISKNIDNKIHGMYLLKNKGEPVLTLEPLNSSGKWGKVSYSNCRKGKPVGDVFVDIDFDGRFDFKIVNDSNGNRVSRSIFFNSDWQIVDYANLNKMKAKAGETEYLFDPNSGCWVEYRDVNE
jgi:hypothetical protein